MLPTGVKVGAATFALGLGAWTVAAPPVAFADTIGSAGTASSSDDSGSSPARAGLAHRGPRATTVPKPSAATSSPSPSASGTTTPADTTIDPKDPALSGVAPDAGRGGRVSAASQRGRAAASTMSTIDMSAQSSPAVGSVASPASPSPTAPPTLPTAAVSSPVTGTNQAAALDSVPAPAAAAVIGAAPGSEIDWRTRLQPPAAAGTLTAARFSIEHLMDTVGTWLSILPSNPTTDFLSGSLWLARRALFPVGSGVGLWGSAACVATKDCSGKDLTGADFEKADLSGVNFQSSTLKNVNFRESNLTNAKFAQAVLVGANLEFANFTKAILTGAILGRTNWLFTNMTGADLRDVWMVDFSFDYVNFSDANLSGAKLFNSTFQHGQLIRANLTDADMSNAKVIRTDLTGADLRGANLAGIVWALARCPNGTQSDKGCSA